MLVRDETASAILRLKWTFLHGPFNFTVSLQVLVARLETLAWTGKYLYQ